MSDTLTPTPYTVKLPLFEGPLDLLLHLIEREKLDITAISLAIVADQFMAYLAGLAEVRADVIADFLAVAARLLLIKSRWLLPKPPADDEELEEDPAETLARRLRDYKRFKQAAALLQGLESQGLRSHVRVAPPPALEPRLDLDGMSVEDLIAVMQQALAVEPELLPVDPVVAPRKMTVREKIERIERLVSGGLPIPFVRLLDNANSRVEIVVSLWAVLELIKRGRLRAQQQEPFGEILLMDSRPAGGV